MSKQFPEGYKPQIEGVPNIGLTTTSKLMAEKHNVSDKIGLRATSKVMVEKHNMNDSGESGLDAKSDGKDEV